MAGEATKVPFIEAAAPSTPAASRVVIYAKSDGLMYSKDDAGAETLMSSGGSGSVATDAIWDAAGDLAVGSGANTAAKLTLGSTGKVPASNGSTLAYVYPPGYVHNHTNKTSNTNITGTTEGGANTIVTASGGVAFDGSTPARIRFYTPACELAVTGSNNFMFIVLFDDTGGGAAAVGQMALNFAAVSTAQRIPILAEYYYTPSNATHTYSVRGYLGAAGTGVVYGGSAGSGAYLPAFIEVLAA